jgi:GR25 family glycosyltransferase involved in LPS biosynthesis
VNRSKRLSSAFRFIYSLFSRIRTNLPRQRTSTFSAQFDAPSSAIGPIFVINLDRKPRRWSAIEHELSRIVDAAGMPLSGRAVRYSACDAQADPSKPIDAAMVEPIYTLGDQLFVEPQPRVVPDVLDLERPITMTRAEIAIAYSHIGIWKKVAQSDAPYSLVLEDDVQIERGFARILDEAWREMEDADRARPGFDILYVSYAEVRHGAPKELVSTNVFRPERGLWYLSGYVLSKKGAQALLDLLPSRGPIDLWINHKFHELDVRALRRSVINQRRDLDSTNTYSILPTLSRIGVLDDGEAALFHGYPSQSPVFVFGVPGSGLSSLAMALSMLGYRCCSDFDSVPECELEKLLAGCADRVFNAYVNIGSLGPLIPTLIQRFPSAKYIVMEGGDEAGDRDSFATLAALCGVALLRLRSGRTSGWRDLCQHLNLSPPNAQYPSVKDTGIRTRQRGRSRNAMAATAKRLRHDPSPWIAKTRVDWNGVRASELDGQKPSQELRVSFEDDLAKIQSARWLLRNDTFPGNLGLFRPANVTQALEGGLSLTVIKEPLGVRNFSAAAISSRANFLFGRFEAMLQATNVPGLVTGFFLHRDSPRQEIDVEIRGNRPSQLLVNVFYNPGTDGSKFDYGYRGSPAVIDLGFDASKTAHHFAIEWDPCEIRWFVDHELVHRRASWDPTPIPHLPMKLHVNTWPTSSRTLAGRLALSSLPASATVRHVAVDAYDVGMSPVSTYGKHLNV